MTNLNSKLSYDQIQIRDGSVKAKDYYPRITFDNNLPLASDLNHQARTFAST
jgi:hypothetical protein